MTTTLGSLVSSYFTPARNSRFQKGSGMYACNVCGRNTRSTGQGDNEHVKLCAECYDLAGEANHLSDNAGKLYDPQGAASTLQHLGEKIGMDKAYALHPEVAAAVIALNVVMPQHNHMEDLPAECRAYVVFDDSEMVCVCARSNGDAKRQARKLGMVAAHARRM